MFSRRRPFASALLVGSGLARPLRFSGAGGLFSLLRWAGLLLGVLTVLRAEPVKPDPMRFESEIRAFEAADATNPPPARPILFVGSSSFRLWKDLPASFPGLPVLNRGFGGSHLSDVNHHLDRTVIRYRPSRIVLYAGDNDLAAGKSPETVLGDFGTFVAEVRRRLGLVPIDFLTIKPSPSRLALLHDQRRANRLVGDFCTGMPGLSVVDVWPPMLDRLGAPREELFLADRLHLNTNGYALWADILGRHFRMAPVKP
jgi:lysophospholipase L1-like esterase